ncbi:MAG: inosine/uridine nucleosidase [Gaiellaceae bacterium]|nr:inosine/uridine nucleosidase [Gaiellaceae bacterium]
MTRVILDCDPGHDDAVAILLALANPAIDLVAITTVAGNQTLARTTENARRVLALAGRTDVPVAAGADRPLTRELVVAPDIHGASGIDGAELPEPVVATDPRGALRLIGDELTPDTVLVATGPLTNVAAVLAQGGTPREIVWMGGAIALGNVTPAAEFNAFVDPEAAAAVVASGIPLTIVPLDLTHQICATPEVQERIGALGTPLATAVLGLLRFFESTYRDVFGMPHPPVHDPATIAWLIDPTLFGGDRRHVAIETEGRYTAGMTVVDVHGKLGLEPNALVLTRVDAAGFWDLVIEALRQLGESR